METALRIATLNVRGMSAKRRQYQLSRLFTENDLDVIAVQETKIESQEQTDRMVQPFASRYNVCVCHANGFSGGCAIFFRKTMGISVETVVVCETGRLVVCDFFYENKQWRVMCVYAPNDERERKSFFEGISAYLKCEKIIVLLGDFNCVCYAEDRVKNQPVRDMSARYLTDLVQEHGLEDIGAVMSSGKSPQYTHYQQASHARLDRAYISAELVPICGEYEVVPVSFSDHCLVYFTLGRKPKHTRFNWELWKLNDKLLEDEGFVTGVKRLFDKLFKTQSNTFIEPWEEFKIEVKILAIERGCVLRQQQRKQENELKRELEFLLIVDSSNPGIFHKQIREVKQKLEIMDQNRYAGAVVRARAERLWMGEAPTKRSLSDEKCYAVRNEIKQIRYQNDVTSDPAKIAEAFVEHYRNLFGKKLHVEEGFKNEFLPLMTKLDNDAKAGLEAPISASEIEQAIDELTAGKAPGPDGLGAAFYKLFKCEMTLAMHRLLVDAYKENRMPPSFRRTHIILVPKTEDSVQLLSVTSYRPISLTNVDYKIYMKVLAKRLQTVMKVIVGAHQTCGIKGRTIFTNIHVARSILECCDAVNGRVAILQVDLEKAFDRVAHEVLFCILEYVNVGSLILDGVKMCYRDCFASVIVNKQVTPGIELLSSVKQGCPLSALLFAIYLEPFCLKIKNSERISGFKFFETEVKVLAYADDIAIICSDKESVREAVKEAGQFCKLTGSAISWNKSFGFWHGDWDDTPEVFENMQWAVTPANYLGVPLRNYRQATDFWTVETERAKVQTTKWGGRDLSMFARTTVCNLFLVAKVFYVLQVLSMTRVCVQKLHRVYAVFVWGSVWERTSRTNLFRSVRKGGLGLCHLFLKQIVSRFFFLRDQNNSFLRTVIQVRLRDYLPQFIVSSNGGGKTSIRGFMREVVCACELLRVRFSMEYLSNVPRKKLYKDLIDVMLPIPLYRSMYAVGSEGDVLKRVKKMPVRASVKSFFFQLHSGTLPVKPWLQEKGLFIPWNINCRICSKPETIEHIFLDCSDAIFHWDILQRTLKKDLPIHPFGIRFLNVGDTGGVPLDMFMLISMHSLWRTRMADRNADPNARPAREYFIESMVCLREVYRTLSEPPEWLPLLDDLVQLKMF